MHNRALLIVSLSALAACYTTPAIHEPTVRIAPAYGVVAPIALPLEEQPGATPVVNTMIVAVPSVRYRTSDVAAPFWRDLGDTALTALITEALRASPTIRSAEARLSGARAARRLAAFDLFPTVTASGSALRSQQSVGQIPGALNQFPRRDLYDFGFDASWELDIFGRTQRNVGAQKALTASAGYAVEDVQVSLAAEVARTYFDMRGAERQLAVAKRNAENQRHTVSLTEDRLRAGRGTAFDTERARSVLQLTLASVPSLEAAISAQRYRLATLVGRTADELPASVYSAADLPRLPDSLDVGSPAQLIRHRPDVLRAERLVAASELFVGASRADYLPTFSIGASGGYAATRLQSLTAPGSSRFFVGPTVSFPLLDIGRVRQRVAAAGTREDEARAQYDATVLRRSRRRRRRSSRTTARMHASPYSRRLCARALTQRNWRSSASREDSPISSRCWMRSARSSTRRTSSPWHTRRRPRRSW